MSSCVDSRSTPDNLSSSEPTPDTIENTPTDPELESFVTTTSTDDPDPIIPPPVFNSEPSEPTLTSETTPTESSSIPSFTPNDVTILFPAPTSSGDLMLKLTDFDSDRVLPQDKFDQTIRISTGPFGKVKNTQRQIGFRSTPNRADWVISGIRIDPGAPGLTKNIFDEFGKSPQIRLVAQPVRHNGFDFHVEDITLHLVYAFHDTSGPSHPCQLHNTPDMVSFTSAVNDLKAIKDKFAAEHGVNTAGPLNVHPAFSVAPTEFKNALRDYLNTHLTSDTLFAVSIAGIPRQFEPWIFLAMANTPAGLSPVPSPAVIQTSTNPAEMNFSQMLSFLDQPRVQPDPATRNESPVSCQPAAGVGKSTSEAFNRSLDIDVIAPVIADVTKSHFFNTDCVSCHTETRKQIDDAGSRENMRAKINEIAAQSGIDTSVIPHGNWNVRAMGWAPTDAFNNTPGAHETIARRAATETAEVVECFHTDKWNSVTEACLP